LGLIRILAAFVFIVSIPVALVTSNIRYMANEARVYRYAIDQYDAVATTGIARDELIRAGAEIRAYFNNNEKTLSINVREGGHEASLFNPRETAHMQDVKDRFLIMNKAQEFSVLYALGYIAVVVLWAREVSLRALAIQVAAGSAVCIVVIGIIGAIGAAGFDSAWENFHQILFTNDFWQLNPATDHLIQMFPPAFWENIVFFIGTLVLAESVLLVVGALIYIGASRHHATERMKLQYAAG
jgi:integral membrane protein (TIGR01906 family)